MKNGAAGTATQVAPSAAEPSGCRRKMKYEMDIPGEAWGRFNQVGQRPKDRR